jgi:hypothetical protein
MLSMFSIAMFLGSYLSGLVPLAFNLSEVSYSDSFSKINEKTNMFFH